MRGGLLTAAFVLAGASGCLAPAFAGPDPTRPGDWLLVSGPGDDELSLLDCPSGRPLARARHGLPAAGSPLLAGGRAHVLGGGRLVSLALPGLGRIAERDGLPAPGQMVAAEDAAGLLAIGGAGEHPLRIVDAATLADVHVYPFEAPASVTALAHVPGRASFLAAPQWAAAGPPAVDEAWELAYSPDAPPVLKGLVHDYRMGEAVPLPGQFTPRPLPLGSPTAGFVAGPVPYEWLRIDQTGAASVLHLEVRREIARLDGTGDWLAAAWRDPQAQARGWLVGMRGATWLSRFESLSWRLTAPQALPGRLLAMQPLAGLEGAVLALAVDGGVALAEVDGATLVLGLGPTLPGQRASLAVSADRRCVALLDEAGNWLAALRR